MPLHDAQGTQEELETRMLVHLIKARLALQDLIRDLVSGDIDHDVDRIAVVEEQLGVASRLQDRIVFGITCFDPSKET